MEHRFTFTRIKVTLLFTKTMVTALSFETLLVPTALISVMVETCSFRHFEIVVKHLVKLQFKTVAKVGVIIGYN